MLLIPLSIAWMVGVVVADLVALPRWALVGVALAGGVVAFVGRPTRWIHWAGLALVCAALGAWRYQAVQPTALPWSIQQFAGQSVTLRGEVVEDPKRTEDGQQVVLTVQALQQKRGDRQAEGLVLINLPPYPQFRYGQVLVVAGPLRTPNPPKRPGEFDYQRYLARRNIFVLMREPFVTVVPSEQGLPLLRTLYAFRDHCRALMLRMLPEPQASLAVGILLGLQASIPEEVYTAFSVTGTSHILVVSGWNFTIVATVLAALGQRLRLGRVPLFWSSLAMMWLYALFVGATATVLRAAVMASLALVARATERRSHPWTLLLGACWLLSAQNPQTLWDLGFQLSALATGSLFAFGKPVEGVLSKVPLLNHPALGWANEALTATLAAQILTLPVILYNFGNLSLIAPLANVLLVPVVPYAMLFGTVALLAGLLWLPLAQGLALAAWLPLTWLSEGARLLSLVPWAATSLPPFPLWVLLGYYLLVGVAWGMRLRKRGASANSD